MKHANVGNVTITPSKKGYFLTIKDPQMKGIEHTWAVTEEELRDLKKALESL